MPAFAVVGIGVNVHQSQFPEGLDTPATSLDREAGKRIPRQALLVALLQSLEREMRALADARAMEAIPRGLKKHLRGYGDARSRCTGRKPARA